MSPMNRWQALALLTALPYAARLGAQIRPTLRHRVILGFAHGFLLEPGGTLKAWLSQNGTTVWRPTGWDSDTTGHRRHSCWRRLLAS